MPEDQTQMTVTAADLAGFAERLAAWAEAASETDRALLTALLTRAADAPADDTGGYAFGQDRSIIVVGGRSTIRSGPLPNGIIIVGGLPSFSSGLVFQGLGVRGG